MPDLELDTVGRAVHMWAAAVHRCGEGEETDP